MTNDEKRIGAGSVLVTMTITLGFAFMALESGLRVSAIVGGICGSICIVGAIGVLMGASE